MSDQPSLFEADVPRAVGGADVADGDAPLAARMRPRTLDEYVGQQAIIGPGTVLRQALEADQLPSLILWGPPGSGKTTFARLAADLTRADIEALSAVSSGVADLRAAVDRARLRRGQGRRTLLFIDEIHRFTKTQQDAILPHVESGLVRLLGATTENPSHQVNAALLSRARVVRLEALDSAALGELVNRALADTERGLGSSGAELTPEARDRLIEGAGGDARVVLDALELAVHAASRRGAVGEVSVADVEGALQQPALLFDRAGDQHFWVISAFIKSIRGTDPDAAIYWLARLLEAGEDPRFVARRLVIVAAEDIGLADPMGLQIAVAAQHAVEFIGMPEGMYPLAEATLYLAAAPKSDSIKRAYAAVLEDVRSTLALPVPLHLRNPTSTVDRAAGFGDGYRYAHDHPDAIVEQLYLPEQLRDRRYYRPTDHGREAQIAGRLREVADRLAARRSSNPPPAAS